MSSPSESTNTVRQADGSFDISALKRMLLVTKAELAASMGLTLDDELGDHWQASDEGQRRIDELVYVLERTTPWIGHPRMAFAWYRSQPLPSFGDMTAEDLLKMDRFSALSQYLERVESGGFA